LTALATVGTQAEHVIDHCQMHGGRQRRLAGHFRPGERLQEVGDGQRNLPAGDGCLPAQRPGAAFEARRQPFRDRLVEQRVGFRKLLGLEDAQGGFEIGLPRSDVGADPRETGSAVFRADAARFEQLGA
jgi:hypothetical protein